MTSVALTIRILPIVCSFVMVGLSPFASHASPERDWQETNEQIVRFQQQLKLKEAIPLAQEVLSRAENLYGQRELQTATSLVTLAELHRRRGDYSKAEPLFQRALTIQKAKLGTSHQGTATTLFNLGRLYILSSDHSYAQSYLEEALAIREKVLGPEDPDTATTLYALGELYEVMERYDAAESALARALKIRERIFSTNHPEVSRTRQVLVQIQGRVRALAEAVELARHVDEMEKALKAPHPDLVEAHFRLGEAYYRVASIEKAYQNITRAESMLREASLKRLPWAGKFPMTTRPWTAEVHSANLALQELRQGSPEDPLVRKLTEQEAALGLEHPDLVPTLEALAKKERVRASYGKVEDYLSRALAIRERVFGKKYQDLKMGECFKLGDSRPCMDLFKLGRDLESVRRHKQEQGERQAQLDAKWKRTWECRDATRAGAPLPSGCPPESAHVPERPRDTSTVKEAMKNVDPDMLQRWYQVLLGVLQVKIDAGTHAKAPPRNLTLRSRDHAGLICSHPDGTRHVASGWVSFWKNKSYRGAEKLLKVCLEIAEEEYQAKQAEAGSNSIMSGSAGKFGTKSNPLALSKFISGFRSVGEFYREQFKHELADVYYNRAVEIAENVYGRGNKIFTDLLLELAWERRTDGDMATTAGLLRRALESEEQLHRIALLSPAEELEDLILSASDRTPDYHAALAFFGSSAQGHYGPQYALDTLLARKAILLDKHVSLQTAMESSSDPHVRSEWAKLKGAMREYTNLYLYHSKTMAPEVYKAELHRLREVMRTAKGALSLDPKFFSYIAGGTAVSTREVARRLPANARLVEFRKMKGFDWKHGKLMDCWKDGEKVGELTDCHRYLALVLRADERVDLVDLGDADAIDKTIKEFRESTQGNLSASAVNEKSEGLYEILWAPLEQFVGDARELIISPDGQLNLVPFAALRDPDGEYLIEKAQITYVATGRDLVQKASGQEGMTPPVLFAHPAYDKKLIKCPFVEKDFKGTFPPLCETKAEADQIGPLVPIAEERRFFGEQASEDRVLALRRPRILHLATHGFFCPKPDSKSKENDSCRTGVLSFIAQAASLADKLDKPRDKEAQSSSDVTTKIENPLFRSGLALAGAEYEYMNKASGQLDGILTGYEASGMDLRGTELVVLSACDTGVGDVKNGDGIAGLRRAFQLAGARNIVMSLWKVDDALTAQQMVSFYKLYSQGRSPAEALRSAQLATIKELREKNRKASPKLWAPFIVQGLPGQ